VSRIFWAIPFTDPADESNAIRITVDERLEAHRGSHASEEFWQIDGQNRELD
jgi:hypothetical protein